MALDLKVVIGYLNRLPQGTKEASSNLEVFASKANAVGQRMAAVGAAITGSMMASLHSAAAYGDELAKASDKSGVAVEALSRLRYAAEQSDVDFTLLTNSVGLMQRKAYEASQGALSQKEAFDALGVSVTDASGNLKGGEALFMELAEALAKTTNESEKAALASLIFGRGGRMLLPMLKDGAAGIRELTERAEKLGMVWTEEGARAAERYNDALNDVKLATRGLGRTLVTDLGPAIAGTAEKLAESIGKLTEWADKHPQAAALVSKAALAIGLALGVGGPVLMAVPHLVAGLKIVQGWFVVEGKAALLAASETEVASARMRVAITKLGPVVLALHTLQRASQFVMEEKRTLESEELTDTEKLWDTIQNLRRMQDPLTRGFMKWLGEPVPEKSLAAKQDDDLTEAEKRLSDALDEMNEAMDRSSASTETHSSALEDVIGVLAAVKAAYQGIIDKQREWVSGITEAANARTELASAWVGLLEARGVTGPALAQAKGFLARVQYGAAGEAAGAAQRARWLPDIERQQLMAGAFRMETSAWQTWRGINVGQPAAPTAQVGGYGPPGSAPTLRIDPSSRLRIDLERGEGWFQGQYATATRTADLLAQ